MLMAAMWVHSVHKPKIMRFVCWPPYLKSCQPKILFLGRFKWAKL